MSPDGLLLRQSCKSLAEKWRVHVNRELSSNGPSVALDASGHLGFPAVSIQSQDRGRNGFFLETVVAVTGEADQAGSDKEGLCGG